MPNQPKAPNNAAFFSCVGTSLGLGRPSGLNIPSRIKADFPLGYRSMRALSTTVAVAVAARQLDNYELCCQILVSVYFRFTLGFTVSWGAKFMTDLKATEVGAARRVGKG